MLYIESTSFSVGDSVALFNRPDAIFRWRTSGHGCAKILTETPGKTACPIKPQDFFNTILKIFGDLDWREQDAVIEMAVPSHRKGRWIGRGGRKIKALQRHLGKRIILVDAEELSSVYDQYRPAYVVPTPILEKYTEDILEPCLMYEKVYLGGYIAPWKFPSIAAEAKTYWENTQYEIWKTSNLYYIVEASNSGPIAAAYTHDVSSDNYWELRENPFSVVELKAWGKCRDKVLVQIVPCPLKETKL